MDQEIMSLIQSGEPKGMVQGLLRLALEAGDREPIEDIMITYSRHGNEQVRGIALLCFGHVARRFGRIDKERVMPVLEEGLLDGSLFVRRHAASAQDEIGMSCK